MEFDLLGKEKGSAFSQFSLAWAARVTRTPVTSEQEWSQRRESLRTALQRSFGAFPPEKTDLTPRIIGRIDRDGYHIEKLVIQSRPGVWITANAYVPHSDGPFPGVLSVHGHWPWARVDPTPHSRAVGLVKMGYFVLAVDAIGAGERAVIPKKGSYHGALQGASTWPSGMPLIGLQVYDNMRATDYLQSRPEVDSARLAMTGASGGGNQTLYCGAFDERFKAVVPVCSIGTFEAYLQAACCVCEVLPGGLSFSQTGEILGLVAPRALMVISASRDAFQFSVAEAQKSLVTTRGIYDLQKSSDKLKHVIIDSGHNYNQPMREAMYGWLALHLKDEGNGDPVPEPELDLEDVDELRCFAGTDRPKDFVLIPEMVRTHSLEVQSRRKLPDHGEQWEADSWLIRRKLAKEVLGGWSARESGPSIDTRESGQWKGYSFETMVIEPEPNIQLPTLILKATKEAAPTVIVVNPKGKNPILESELLLDLLKAGWNVVLPDLRATGETVPIRNRIADASDHNASEWSVWIGRPLLGQWAWDVSRTIEYLHTRKDVNFHQLAVIGFGAAGLASVMASALDDRITSVAAVEPLSSYTLPGPVQNHDMANSVPFILDVCDIPELLALCAPRRVLCVNPVDAQHKPLNNDAVRKVFAPTNIVYKMLSAERQFLVTGELPGAVFAEAIRAG